jgi:hypothetical protein
VCPHQNLDLRIAVQCALRIADPHPVSVLSEKLGGKRRTIRSSAIISYTLASSVVNSSAFIRDFTRGERK